MSKMYRRHFLGMASDIARKATDKNIVIGPCLYHPQGGAYFIVARGLRNVALDVDQVKAQPGVDITEVRAKLVTAFKLLGQYKIHDENDEEQSVLKCMELWPCKQLDEMWRHFENQKAALKIARKH